MASAMPPAKSGHAPWVDLRDWKTEGPIQRITEMSIQLAQRIGLNESDLVNQCCKKIASRFKNSGDQAASAVDF
jgi:hypothetical protein